MVIAKLSLRLSLKKERTNERKKKERERASSMPNDMATTGNRAPQVEFLSSVLPVL